MFIVTMNNITGLDVLRKILGYVPYSTSIGLVCKLWRKICTPEWRIERGNFCEKARTLALIEIWLAMIHSSRWKKDVFWYFPCGYDRHPTFSATRCRELRRYLYRRYFHCREAAEMLRKYYMLRPKTMNEGQLEIGYSVWHDILDVVEPDECYIVLADGVRYSKPKRVKPVMELLAGKIWKTIS
jgi:hypothetical protein